MPVGTQVLIKTHAVGICGSDIALYGGTYGGPSRYPMYFGHEWSGTVEAVGPQVERLQPGDKVTGDCSVFCGECALCARNKNLCRQIEKRGITVDGASRQYFLQDEKYLYRAPPEADLDLITLSEPLAVAMLAVERVHSTRPELERERILVLGGGTIGYSCLLSLKHGQGCSHVELFDILEPRIVKARELGADWPSDVLHGPERTVSYEDYYSGQGYDVIFETSGTSPAFHQALHLVRPMGTIMTLGFVPPTEVNVRSLVLKAGSVMGSIGGTGAFLDALRLVMSHPELVRTLITHRFSYPEFENAFRAAADRRSAIKVLVSFSKEGGQAYGTA